MFNPFAWPNAKGSNIPSDWMMLGKQAINWVEWVLLMHDYHMVVQWSVVYCYVLQVEKIGCRRTRQSKYQNQQIIKSNKHPLHHISPSKLYVSVNTIPTSVTKIITSSSSWQLGLVLFCSPHSIVSGGSQQLFAHKHVICTTETFTSRK